MRLPTSLSRSRIVVLAPLLLVASAAAAASCGASDQTKKERASGGEAGLGGAAAGETSTTGAKGGRGGSTTGGRSGGVAGETSGGEPAAGGAEGGVSSGGAELGGVAGTSGGIGGVAGAGGSGPSCGGANLQTDPLNCGICQRACAVDGVCSHGHCMQALVSKVNSLAGVAVDATYVYYGTHNSGDIFRVPVGGGLAEVVVTKNIKTQVEQLIISGSSLFWTTYSDQSVLTAPSAGNTAKLLSGTESVPYGIATNGTDVFWANHYQPANSIGHSLVGGAAPKNPVISGSPEVNYPTYVAADATNLYWANAGTSGTNGSVYRSKLDGTTPVALATGQYPVYGLALDATNVYFTTINTGTVSMVPKTSNGSVAPTPLGQNEGYVYGIVVDATDIYWLDTGKGVLRHRAKNAQAPETIAEFAQSKLDAFLGSPTYLTLDADNVYYSDAGTQSGHGAIVAVTRK